jgi:Tfp pilus assembly protein PilF
MTGCGDDDKEPGPSPSSTVSSESSGESSGESSEASPDSAVDTLVQSGLDQLAAGDSEAARTTFENVLAIDPGNLYANYNLAVIADGADQDDEALGYYDQALATQPDYAPALYNKAIILETRDLDQSIELYRQIIEIDDQMASAFMRLGFALIHQGQPDEGTEFLEQGIRLDPAMKEIQAPSYE